ncbi:hypothetical protein Tco_1419416 [Tanacetum coccineum]
MVVKSKVIYDFPRFFGLLIAELATGGMVNFTLKMNEDMIIENLDLEPKIDATFRGPCRLKELSKETSSEILPSGDGSRRSSESTSFRKSLRCWFGSSDRSPWNEHPFCTNRMVSDHRDTTLFPLRSSMVFR